MLNIHNTYGIENRGAEVIKALEEKGGINSKNLSGDEENCLYYIGFENNIVKCDLTSSEAATIQFYGEEIEEWAEDVESMYEKKKQTWHDLDKTHGFCLCGDEISKDVGLKRKCIFATEQQAKSAQAAAMINQLRAQLTNLYGEIIEHGKKCYRIKLSEINEVEIIEGTCEGMLCFDTEDHAKLFFENNIELVEEYLKTF